MREQTLSMVKSRALLDMIKGVSRPVVIAGSRVSRSVKWRRGKRSWSTRLTTLPDLYGALLDDVLDRGHAEFELSPERRVAVQELHLLGWSRALAMVVADTKPVPERPI